MDDKKNLEDDDAKFRLHHDRQIGICEICVHSRDPLVRNARDNDDDFVDPPSRGDHVSRVSRDSERDTR